jgi:hypothetical protein
MRLLSILALFTACATTPANPTPKGCPPGDLLSCAVFDCRAEWVSRERGDISTDVGVCLAGDDTAACLVAIVPRAHPDTVGCVARDRAAMACASVTAVAATAADAHACPNGRAWILAEKVSFR